ncbi:YkvA family protein [Methanobrevibacter boviskoreani]|uniref:YkvA family protein n=1 Tax=Methanobrevibacter boviskoreani TaxID=1348249 RepID=UPI0023A8F1B7|nr:DUF1232 domain-containing protein [Methanobrevibacter boviskoreani]MCI6775401.1 DUF1232 domain-containing protein [Methanobrevibacter boviskoreani]MDY5613836.1 DUF1232 domain-containing protein [Methanobrevibacter boviskoreani]
MVFKNFSNTLIENLNSFDDGYASFIDYAPDLFSLLCDILDEKIINQELRVYLTSAIAYFVIPNDVISEEIYGAYGYVDDIYISVYVLRKVADENGYEILQKHWNDDSNIENVINECYDSSLELLEDKVYDVLSYVGLID